MPQTRFVLSKALEMGHKIIIVVNKIDRPDARLDEIGDEVLELLLDLDASEEQLESPLLFCSGRSGTASLSQYEAGTDLKPLFDTIINYIEPPKGDETEPLQMLISSIGNRDYPVVQAIIVLVAFVVVTCNFLADILYRVMDPRLKDR